MNRFQLLLDLQWQKSNVCLVIFASSIVDLSIILRVLCVCTAIVKFCHKQICYFWPTYGSQRIYKTKLTSLHSRNCAKEFLEISTKLFYVGKKNLQRPTTILQKLKYYWHTHTTIDIPTQLLLILNQKCFRLGRNLYLKKMVWG